MSTTNTYKFVANVTRKGRTLAEVKQGLEKKLGVKVKRSSALSDRGDEARFVVTIPANGRTQAEERAMVEKKLGSSVSYLGRVLHAAKVNEARWGA
jgi:ribosomal protein L23